MLYGEKYSRHLSWFTNLLCDISAEWVHLGCCLLVIGLRVDIFQHEKFKSCIREFHVHPLPLHACFWLFFEEGCAHYTSLIFSRFHSQLIDLDS